MSLKKTVLVDNANGHLPSNGLYTTDSHGEIHISGVTGTIVVKETRTIPGYTIDESTRIQTVVVNPQDTQTLTFYNAPKQSLTIQKYVDGTADPIQGVTFLIDTNRAASPLMVDALAAAYGVHISINPAFYAIAAPHPTSKVVTRAARACDIPQRTLAPQHRAAVVLIAGSGVALDGYEKPVSHAFHDPDVLGLLPCA